MNSWSGLNAVRKLRSLDSTFTPATTLIASCYKLKRSEVGMRVGTAGVVLMAALLLGGCKLQSATEVPLSAIEDETVTAIPGLLRVEVMSCDSYEDSRQPSDSLIEAQENIPRIFPDAEYEQCYTQRMDSFAQFSIPVGIDRTADEVPVTSDTFNLLTPSASSLELVIPEALTERIEQAQSNPMMPSLALDVRLLIVNDTSEERRYTVWSAWVDGHPGTVMHVDLAPEEEMDLRLSDVSVDQAMKLGWVEVLSPRPDA